MRQLVVVLVLLSMIADVASAAHPDSDVRPGGVRVRPSDARTIGLLREGIERSSTLRALVDRIEQLDVIVYLEMQPRMRHQLSGGITWMHSTPRYRYVRASLNPDLSNDALIAAIGHELRHVLEIAEEPGVADAFTLVEFYRTIGDQRQPGSGYWDTSRARETGRVVRRELASAERTKAAEVTTALPSRARQTSGRERAFVAR